MGLLEANGNGKDEELEAMPTQLNKVMKSNQAIIQKAMEKKKSDDKKMAKEEEEAEYAYTPKQGFDWDNVSGAIGEII